VRSALKTLAFIVMLALGAARAGENGNPLVSPYQLPFYPFMPMNGSCNIGARFAIANNLQGETSDWGTVSINLEEWRLELALRQSIGALEDQNFEVGAQFSVKALWGGILDVPLDAFHALLGVGKNPPDQQNQVLLYTQFGSGGIRRIDDTTIGVGDPVLWIAGASPSDGFGAWFYKLQFQIPLGDSSRFLGAGVGVFGGSVSYNAWNWGATANLSIPLEGAKSVFEGTRLQTNLGLLVWYEPRFEFLPGFLRTFRLEMSVVTNPFPISSRINTPALGIRIGFGGFGFSEDLNPGAPDVIFDQRLEFGCPW
jgi:hypothetical protein